MKIKNIKAREILDSRGNPTIEVDLLTKQGVFSGAAPSGASTGRHEALELRDGGKRYGGKGVLKAVENVNEKIRPELIGKDVSEQKTIDSLMIKLDGTENKSNLGANALLAVSMAACRAGAGVKSISLWQHISQLAKNDSSPILPSPCLLLVEGGLHAGNDLDVQEFMIVPSLGAKTFQESFKERLRMAVGIYHTLGEILKREHGSFSTNVGLEGGFAAPLFPSTEVLGVIVKAVKEADLEDQIEIILDMAASHFYKDGLYPVRSKTTEVSAIPATTKRTSNGVYKLEGGSFSREGLLSFYKEIIKKYPIFGIEDPFDEEDWQSFKTMLELFGEKIVIIGDDLLATNIKRIEKAVKEKACNGLILKLNQIGTVSETIEAATLAKNSGWEVFVKHRSGETNDDFIADLAVGLGSKYIMAGAPTRGERMAKYNRLLRIEEELKE